MMRLFCFAAAAAALGFAGVGNAQADELFPTVVIVGGPNGWRCSGVLVASDAVLTAAHCLPAISVGFGDNVRGIRKTIRVSSAVPHPDGLDVAILLLAGKSEITPSKLREIEEPVSGTLRIVGFGANDPDGRVGFGKKRFKDVYVADATCSVRTQARAGCRPNAELVVFGGGATDACDGDSGGPVFEGDFLVAVTSRSIVATRSQCGDGGVYVRVDSLDEWLCKNLKCDESGRLL